MEKKSDHLPEAQVAQDTIATSIENILKVTPKEKRDQMGHALKLIISEVRDGLNLPEHIVTRKSDSKEYLYGLSCTFDEVKIKLEDASRLALTEEELASHGNKGTYWKEMVKSIRERFEKASEGGKRHFVHVAIRASDIEKAKEVHKKEHGDENTIGIVELITNKLREAGATEEEIRAVRSKYVSPRAG